MDALRASTMLLLVPVHAAGLSAINGHEGVWATVVFWLVHVFRMPLFFAMSGFFLALMLTRKGMSQTARNRSLRIAVPLVIGFFTLIPLMSLAAQWTGVAISADGVPEGAFALEPNFLWFLWYLLIIDAVAVVLYLGAPRLLRAAGERMRWLIAHPSVGILLLAIPTVLALWPEPSWTAVAPIDTFVPEVPAMAYYTIFFAFGATLFVHRDLVEAMGRNAWAWTAAALATTLPAGALFTLHNSSSGSRPAVHGTALLVYAVSTWASLSALVGLAHRYLNRPRPALRYLADASYWIYLSHFPAMVVVFAAVGAISLGTGPQFFLVTMISLTFSLITYPLLVRYTVIGRVLNGPRERTTYPDSGRAAQIVSRPLPGASSTQD